MSTNTQAAPQQNQVAKQEPTQSERFMNAVLKEFQGNVGFTELTNYQKRLIQNYFVKIDMVLGDADQARLRKNEANTDHKWDNTLPITWANVNMKQLAFDVVAYSGVGIDAMQPNHTNPIPYRNKKTNQYDITFIHGYRGIEVKAKKYGLDVPDNVIVEVVYKNDTFKPIKKDRNNPVETYEFEQQPFDRGEIVGGFYYHEFTEKPEKNKLKTFSMQDIQKRKPEYAAAEFWGGSKQVKKWNKKTNGYETVTEEVEGWLDEMVYKTVYRAAFNAITIDSEKIDDNYMAVMKREHDLRDLQLLEDIKEHANKTEVGFEKTEIDQKPSSITDIPAEDVKPDPKEVKKENSAPDWA